MKGGIDMIYLRRLIVFFFSLCFSVYGFTQNQHKLDSLFLVYETTDFQKHGPKLHEDIYFELSKGKSTRTLNFLNAHLKSVQEKGNYVDLVDTYRWLSSTYLSESYKDTALHYVELAHKVCLDNEDQFLLHKVKRTFASYYNTTMEYDKASEMLYQSLDYFKNNDNKEEYAASLSQLGSFASRIGTIGNAKEYLTEALEIYKELNDKASICEIYYQLGVIHVGEGNLDKAALFFDNSVALSKELHYQLMLSANYFSLAGLYDQKEQLEKSRDYINKAIELDLALDTRSGLTYDYLQLGNYFLKVDSLDKAKSTLLEAYNYSSANKQYDLVVTCLSLLSQIEYQLESYKSAADYQIAINQFLDSVNRLYDAEKLQQSENDYNLAQQEQEHKMEQQKTRFTNILVITGISALMIIGFLLWWLARSKMKQVDMEKQKLQEELNYKNKQLTTNVMYLVNKNELIASISKKLVQLKLTSVKEENKQILSELVSEIQSNLNDEIWKEFEVRFQEVHSDFYEKLNKEFPDLTVNERRLAAFLRLNMTTKEISSITHQSHSAIEMARSRLRKKLNINSTDVNLVSYLSQF